MAGCAIEPPRVRHGKPDGRHTRLVRYMPCAAGQLRAWFAFALVTFCTFFTLALASGEARAARAAYKVDVEASPRSLRKLLEEHLDIARFAKRDDVSDDQFGFLVTATPQQVRDLTATAGYFSPVVRTDVRTVDGKKASP